MIALGIRKYIPGISEKTNDVGSTTVGQKQLPGSRE